MPTYSRSRRKPAVSSRARRSSGNPSYQKRPKDAATFIQAAYRNRPVYNKLAAQSKPKITEAKANTNAITTLAKQVRKLQLSDFGQIQYQVQSLQLSNTNVDDMPSNTEPLLFCFNSFYDVEPLWQCKVVPPIAPFEPQPIISVTKTFRKQAYNVDLPDRYEFNQRANIDTVSRKFYLPVSCNLRFQFSGAVQTESHLPIRYRITIFKLKNAPNQSSQIDVALPNTAPCLWHMCEDDPNQRNFFSKKYHRIVYDKWVTLNPKLVTTYHDDPNHVDPDVGIQEVYRNVNINYRFPRSSKALAPDKRDPAGPTTSYDTLWTNCPQEDLMWCLISCNQPVGAASVQTPRMNIAIQRKLTWRDQHDVGPYAPI